MCTACVDDARFLHAENKVWCHNRVHRRHIGSGGEANARQHNDTMCEQNVLMLMAMDEQDSITALSQDGDGYGTCAVCLAEEL